MNFTSNFIDTNSIDPTVSVAETYLVTSPPINSTSNMIYNVRNFFGIHDNISIINCDMFSSLRHLSTSKKINSLFTSKINENVDFI